MRPKISSGYTCGVLLSMLIVSAAVFAQGVKAIPVVLDTDIGSDIDDAFALAMVLRSPELRLEAVTTVSGDTQARARIAAKMLALAGRGDVPVAAGAMQAGSPVSGASWAEGFQSSALSTKPATELLKDTIQAGRGETVLIAIGALTNIAALLQRYPQEKLRIKEIILMGGSFSHGYTVGSGQIAESNIASDAPAAQTVFSSGIPIRMAPLDVTARLQLQPNVLQEIFVQHTPLTESLHAQYLLWGQPVPTLHDPMAIALLLRPSLCRSRRAHVVISSDGWTRVGEGAPNALVALETLPASFISYYRGLLLSGAQSVSGQAASKSRP